MDTDDILKGRILTRREILALMGAAGAAMVVACTGGDDGQQAVAPTSTEAAAESTQPAAAESTAAASGGETTSASTAAVATSTSRPTCIVTPELTEGPYFVDEMLERSDVRSDPAGGEVRAGVELTLTLNVYSVAGGSCSPLEGAIFDIWHCDALGEYSDVSDNSQGFDTRGEKWLRGYQYTDANGQVKFTTIYPGWYQGRATHIHFKVRRDNEEFTSQFFFQDTLSDEIHDNESPYSPKGAGGRQQNSQDGIYRQSNGMTLLDVQPSGSGYAATFEIGVQS